MQRKTFFSAECCRHIFLQVFSVGLEWPSPKDGAQNIQHKNPAPYDGSIKHAEQAVLQTQRMYPFEQRKNIRKTIFLQLTALQPSSHQHSVRKTEGFHGVKVVCDGWLGKQLMRHSESKLHCPEIVIVNHLTEFTKPPQNLPFRAEKGPKTSSTKCKTWT